MSITSLSRRSPLSRRAVLAGCAHATLVLAACGPVATGSQLDQKARLSRETLYATAPETRELATRSAGVLIIPEVFEGSFVVGGAYGEGVLFVGDAVVDYISVSAASFGFQAGAQSFGQALFFTTPEALARFRRTDGWQLGVDAEVVVLEDGLGVGTSTSQLAGPVYEVIYGQRGLLIGASLEGAKYSRLIR